jgi:hypothetical protein
MEDDLFNRAAIYSVATVICVMLVSCNTGWTIRHIASVEAASKSNDPIAMQCATGSGTEAVCIVRAAKE